MFIFVTVLVYFGKKETGPLDTATGTTSLLPLTNSDADTIYTNGNKNNTANSNYNTNNSTLNNKNSSTKNNNNMLVNDLNTFYNEYHKYDKHDNSDDLAIEEQPSYLNPPLFNTNSKNPLFNSPQNDPFIMNVNMANSSAWTTPHHYTNTTTNSINNNNNSNNTGFYYTCKQLYKIIKLPHIHTLVIILLTCKIAFAPADSVSMYKLQEYGETLVY